ncbi:UNVERIFIED_ORG: hypothetical protein J2806_005092 [Kosakonia oryzae]|uniref:Type VI secretion system secreted protein VgrG n=3 Tax=Kosakonia TaxID=1330547 RepID=A0AAX2EZZ1_9ENTR|nr:hypothetical protein [Kosakonia radicincitans]MDP9569392.1 hypothetical protein [Kosakonia oryzae]APG20696.1 hypothetical protein A3780_25190 [Kosakonia radicincitans]SFF41751.1 hypothetical protein SAMN03159468_05149 [Kosakonia radicincitans]SFR26880.1 hypothetical protein SAMN03159514_05099 [Kosakonia radicincitans]SFU18021.1 hypothetical protein SAMN03159428_05112 [Kosakonia radicincitans]
MATAENSSRPLTAGEIRMIKPLFKDAINYSAVKVYNGEYLPFGLQDNRTAMTPNGYMYYPGDLFQEDFSFGFVGNMALFVHEMGHVWQHQMGANVRTRGLFSWAASYEYSLPEEKDLADYNLEQQASIIADYYILTKFGVNVFVDQSTFKGIIGPDLKNKYENTLKYFLASPADKRCLWK